MTQSDHAYLSVLSWPAGFTDDQKIEALVMAAALDPHQARMATHRSTPGVICSIDTIIAKEVLRVLHKLGILALAPTQNQLDNYPKAELPANVEVFPEKELGAFAVRTRDGGAWTFQAPELKMVVFGKARTTTTSIRSEPTMGSSYAAMAPAGAAAGAAMRGDMRHIKQDHRLSVKPMLDLHIDHLTDNGIKRRLVRLVGGRTRIGLIGDGDPRPSLLDDNTPVDDLRELAPDTRYDLGFANFTPPPDAQYRSLHGGDGTSRLSADAFMFYSPWTAIMDTMLHG
ncbi:MAG: hypothetical protein JKY96_00975 [Phycisphaerales bacterium]|nr:hypothetical protein [Phycisphaerales bacterium]